MSGQIKCLVIALRNIPAEYRIILGYLTYHAGRLFNQALWLLKKKIALVNMFDLYNKLNQEKSLNLKSLHSRVAQIILDELARAYKNWLEYLKNPKKFNSAKIRAPKFRHKDKPHKTVIFDKTAFRVEGTKIRLSLSKNLKQWLKEKHDIHVKYLWIKVGVKPNEKLIKNIQIVPIAHANEFEVHIVYQDDAPKEQVEGNKIMVLDPNTSNFFAIVIEGEEQSYLIDSKGLKSLLRKYLKRIAKLQRRLDFLKQKGLSADHLEYIISKLWVKVKRLLTHYAHSVSNLIIYLALKHGVSKIYIGDAVKGKNRESKLSSIVDQVWSLLPHGRVKKYLEYKAKGYGIKVEYISEVYTSGVDSSSARAVSASNYTPELRIKRGLYKTKHLGILNADINACRNFLKKLGKFDLTTGTSTPIRLRIFFKLKESSSRVPLYKGIGRSRGRVNLPKVVRCCGDNTIPLEASHL